MSSKKKIGLGLLVAILFLQLPFFTPAKNQNPIDKKIDITDKFEVPMSIQMDLYNGCYDCHSNYTENYYWYYHIQPLSWWINKHIIKAKEELNFSEFANYSDKRTLKKFKEIQEVMDDKSMPLKSYTIMHPKAKLTDKQFKRIANWAKAMQDSLQTR